MDYAQMTSPCGLDCFNCPMFLATKDEQLKQRIGQELGMSIDNLQCRGCRPEGGLIAFQGMTEPCPIFQCAQQGGNHFCCDCETFPCDLLDPLADPSYRFPCNIRVFNLCLIKKTGVERWARCKARRVRKAYYDNLRMWLRDVGPPGRRGNLLSDRLLMRERRRIALG
jgi:hypothetical protein